MPCDARGSCDQQKDTRRHIVCSTGIQDEISSIDAEFIAGLLERLTIRASRIVNHACSGRPRILVKSNHLLTFV
jgi:hypothetical protein